MDEEGLLPGAMDEMLRDWDPVARGGRRRPHVLYTVPSGQNPTGATQGARRRREIMEVCRRWDVFVIEDEPYYFLQMEPYNKNNKTNKTAEQQQSVDAFLATLLPSLLSLDTDGRVLRMLFVASTRQQH